GLPVSRMQDVRYSRTQAHLVIATPAADTLAATFRSIWRSVDDGATWSQVGANALTCSSRARAYGIAFAPDSSDVYVGTDCGLAVSHDGGATWKNVVPQAPGEPVPPTAT